MTKHTPDFVIGHVSFGGINVQPLNDEIYRLRDKLKAKDARIAELEAANKSYFERQELMVKGIAELEAELASEREKFAHESQYLDALRRTVNWLHDRLGYLPEAHAEALENIDILRVALSDLIDMCETEFEMQKPICNFELMVLPAAREAIEATDQKDTAKN